MLVVPLPIEGNHVSLTPRRRRLLSLATAATLSLGIPAAGFSVLASPAQSADPAADCVQPFPVSEIAAGDQVDGLTVVQGTNPVGFTGEILGVVEDGIAPDVDMIMIDLDMPEFARTGGVWSGMSGSPVYAQDGRLIGAVAYGLSNGPSPIAGVTPFADMNGYLGTTPDVRTGALTGLLSASGQLPALDPDIRWSGAVYTRGVAMQKGEWGASAAAEAVARTTAAILTTSLFLTFPRP